MKQFLVTYHATAADMAESENTSPEDREESMKKWQAWAAGCGDQLIDFGNPLINGKRLSPDGSTSDSGHEIVGYSMIKAEDLEGAKALFKNHPHLDWTAACGIEIHEVMPIM